MQLRPHLSIAEFDNDSVAVISQCPFCSLEQHFTVGLSALHNWLHGGAMIQNAFPNLTPSGREALMTGICDTCWGDDDDDIDVVDDEVVTYDDLTEAHHQALLDEYEEFAQ